MPLTDSLQEEFSAYLNFAEKSSNTGRNALCQEALRSLYELMGKEPPALIWCKSPYQMLTLPSILVGMLFSDAWQIVSTALYERSFDQSWQHDFEEGWQALWEHGGKQLLKGMRKTSRINEHQDLEAPLIAQCKQELASWIQSGKLESFEKKLPKEIIYRQFWAMHMWHLNPVKERLNYQTRILADALSETNPYWQDWVSEKKQLEPFVNGLREYYSSSHTALRSLINRFGGEPANQLKSCIWLPMALANQILCRAWSIHADRDCFQNFKAEIDAWSRLSESTLGVLCLDHVVFACQKPEVFACDDSGRLHSPDGPALMFADSYKEYAWHGVIVEPWIIENPELINIELIESSSNAEIRRVLIERYGQARYLHDSGAEEIHRDDYGVLYRKEIDGDEALVMVKVVNSSPEPDGSFRDYFLRVPPETQTAKQGVAWTFGYEADDYGPLVET